MSVKQKIHREQQPTIQQLQKKVSNLQYSQLHARQNQHKNEKAQLQQKLQLLQIQLQQNRKRESNAKKLNESIMTTFQNNEDAREQHISKSIRMLKKAHGEQLAKIKQAHYRQNKMLEEAVQELKGKYEKQLIESEKEKLQYDRRVLEIKKNYEDELRRQLDDKEAEYLSKIQMLSQKLRQAEGMADVYKDFVQKRRQGYILEDQNYLKPRQSNINMAIKPEATQKIKSLNSFSAHHHYQNTQPDLYYETNRESLTNRQKSRQSRINTLQQNNMKDKHRVSASRQSVRELTKKIDRAIVQLKSTNTTSKLHEKINQKLAKRMHV